MQGSNGAETHSGPIHTKNVMNESMESHSIPSDIEVEEEELVVEGIKSKP